MRNLKKIVILKMVETLDSILNQYGDFQDHIINRGKIDKSEVVVVNYKKE